MLIRMHCLYMYDIYDMRAVIFLRRMDVCVDTDTEHAYRTLRNVGL